MRKRGITQRWILNSMSVILILLMLFGITLVLSVRSYYYQSVEYYLTLRMEGMESTLEQLSTSKTNFDTLAREFVQNFEGKETSELQVLNSEGIVVYSSSGFEQDGGVVPDYAKALTAGDKKAAWSGKSSVGEHVMSVTLAVENESNSTFGGIRYVTSLKNIDHQILLFAGFITLISVAVLFFVLISSSYFMNSIVRPVAEINRAARQIALGDYDSRIEKKSDDEIGELCDTINYMAGEISATEKLKNDFISSVSHELRTPLTAIKGWAETLQQGGVTDQEMTKKGLDVIACEVERLSGIV